MQSAAVLAPLGLASVLGVSGWSKLGGTSSTERMLHLLRLPELVRRRWIAQALPWGEIGLAGLLVAAPAGPITWIAAVAATVLTGIYLVIVVRAMTFEVRPACRCFGLFGAQAITGRTVLRNAVLVLLGIVSLVIAAAGESTIGLLRDMSAKDAWWLAGAVVAVLLTWLIVADDTTVATSPFGDGEEAGGATDYIRRLTPLASLTGPDGRQQTLHELARERPQLLVVTNCACGSTAETWERLPDWQASLPQVDVRFVMSIAPAPLPTDRGPIDVTAVWSDHGGVAWVALGLTSSPSAVLIGCDGMLAGGPVAGVEAISAFAGDIAGELSALGAQEDVSSPAR